MKERLSMCSDTDIELYDTLAEGFGVSPSLIRRDSTSRRSFPVEKWYPREETDLVDEEDESDNFNRNQANKFVRMIVADVRDE